MQNKTVPTIKKKFLDKAVAEIDELETRVASDTRRLKELRNKLADTFHTGEDGTENTEIHGYQVKVVRKLNLSCDKESLEQMQLDDPDLYKKLFKKKTTLEFQKTEAKELREQADKYLTAKQGLPVVSFKRIEEDA